MATPSIQTQRDNLTIGLFLCLKRPYGATLHDILTVCLGYNSEGTYPTNSLEVYERRFREAQRIGRDRLRDRIPGYFTFNAMPFGTTYVYKATWYSWINDKTRSAQMVPVVTTDLKAMRVLRDKDLKTRQTTNRTVRAADNVHEQREALAQRDVDRLLGIEKIMLGDGSLGELVSGFHGLPYADLEILLPRLRRYNFGSIRLSFQNSAKEIVKLRRRLLQEEEKLGTQLIKWVTLQTGLPSDARRLALEDAQRRLDTLQ
jgi:hypothetical protein